MTLNLAETASTTTRSEPRHVELGLHDEQVLEMYWHMLLARRLDERMWILHRQHQVAFHVSGIGHEGVQVATAYALRRGHDFLLPYYRDLCLCLSMGVTPRALMLALYGKAEDPMSGGRQMPAHYNTRDLNIISVSSPVATQIPQASGVGFGIKYQGTDQVALTCFGEGSTAEGDFHEGLNWAGIFKLPVVFLCQNNQYAISVPLEREMPVKNVADRAYAYGMPGVIFDGNDALESYSAIKQAVERARRGEGPTLLEAKTYRPVPHSSDDDDRTYRSREEVEYWKKRDPLLLTRAYCLEHQLLDEAKLQEFEQRAREIIDDANEYARSAPFPAPEAALAGVWGPRPADREA
jgi:2-oxoisovalerate dehydrogenase E1 component alpha subunit